ncbi:TspO/MBR family protein [Sphingomonas flavalba]|uniref:TspO/MBR family protein n=1 Tax=Sphingomonas flavalba TaxID=2559804 RepID=UPI0039DFF2CF
MGEIASRSQIRMALLRRALVTVPGVVLLGFASAKFSGSTTDSYWFQQLALPAFMPPDWLFPVAWTILYALIGIALAVVLNARGAAGRALAIALFVVQLALNLAWSPLFFRLHQVDAAFWLIVALLAAAVATGAQFGRVRAIAGWLFLPYIMWIAFAAALNFSIDRMNPGAGEVVEPAASTNIQV